MKSVTQLRKSDNVKLFLKIWKTFIFYFLIVVTLPSYNAFYFLIVVTLPSYNAF